MASSHPNDNINIEKEKENKILNYISSEVSPKILVLDLDATLICSKESPAEFPFFMEIFNGHDIELKSRLYRLSIDDVMASTDSGFRGEGECTEMWGIERPGCKTFLQWCFKNFSAVGVWSAGKKPYVLAICQKIFVGPGIRSPDFVWTYNECINSVVNKREQSLKDLNILIKSRIGIKYSMTEQNVILVDDRAYSFSATPENGILIPPYTPASTLESLKAPDDALIVLGRWLVSSNFFYVTDVRKLNKSPYVIFGKPGDLS
jgi:hypothetical protein